MSSLAAQASTDSEECNLSISLYLWAELVMKYWMVHEICLLTWCCLRHIWRLMGLYLLSLVWSLKVNLPWGLCHCSCQHHVRCPDTAAAKHSSNCTGNKRKEQIFKSFCTPQPFTASQVLWQETAPATLRNIPPESDFLVWAVFKELSESQAQLQSLRIRGVRRCASRQYTAFINSGRLVLPWNDTSN